MSELAAELGMHKSTVSRLLATLERRGLVRRVGDRFAPGPELARLGGLAVRGHHTRRGGAADARAARGARPARPSTSPCAKAGARSTCSRWTSTHFVGVTDWTGRAAPLHATANGKVLLAFGGGQLAGAALKLTRRTIVDRSELRAELERVRAGGLRGGRGGARGRPATPSRRRSSTRRAPVWPRSRSPGPRTGCRSAKLAAAVGSSASSRGREMSATARLPEGGLMAWELATLSGRADGRRCPSSTASRSTSSGRASRCASPTCSTRSSRASARTGGRRSPPTARAGEGRTNRLDGVVVLSCLDFPAEERPLHEQEAVIDLAGPGAELTPFAQATNVVLTFRPRDGLRQRGARGVGARDDARGRRGPRPADARRPSPPRSSASSCGPADASLPSVAALVQLSDLGPLYYQYLYGVPAGQAGLPRAVDPAELLDGAVTCGEYHWAALRNPTIFFQRNALVRALYREHGRRLRFAGVVLMRGLRADGRGQAARGRRRRLRRRSRSARTGRS